MAEENYVTHKHLNESHKEFKKEVLVHVEKLDTKVDQLNTLVLPMVSYMKQSAENTKEMSESLKDFTRNQIVTNDLFKEKIHEHDLSIQDFKSVATLLTDKKKYNAAVIVAILTVVGAFITGMFQLAPYIFN